MHPLKNQYYDRHTNITATFKRLPLGTRRSRKSKKISRTFNPLSKTAEIMTTYETGATSHAINDLILYADNTRELADLKEKKFQHILKAQREPMKSDFYQLFMKARASYRKEMPSAFNHLYNVTEEQENEFCRLYCEEFQQWKKEN